MVGAWIAAGAAKAATRPALAAAGIAAVLAAGFGLGVGFEHRPRTGFPFNLVGQGLAVQRNDWRALAAANAANWRSMRDDRDAWARAVRECEALRLQERDTRAARIPAFEAARAEAGNSGFDAGYAAGRAMCAEQGGGDGKGSSGAGAGGMPGAGGVRDGGEDFARRWSKGADPAR